MGYTPPYLEVRKVAGGYEMFAPTQTSTDDLKIYANTTDATAALKLYGLGGTTLYLSTGQPLTLTDGATASLELRYVSPDFTILSLIDTKNLFLKTSGTGKIKFGDYTAGAATDSTGYISILDAAGNARKLMVQA